jgi:biopolymer transport protein ExbD
MTAMCDVAFLLLTFFILATKQKPPEVLAVTPPSSISSKAAPDKSILITLTKEGKVFLMLGDDTKKADIIDNVNLTKNLQVSGAELAALKKQEFIGLPFSQ